jgi:hypothetical protein
MHIIFFESLELLVWCGFMQCIAITPPLFHICHCNHCKSLTLGLAAVYCNSERAHSIAVYSHVESAIMTLMPYKECTIYETVATAKAASHHEFHAIQ